MRKPLICAGTPIFNSSSVTSRSRPSEDLPKISVVIQTPTSFLCRSLSICLFSYCTIFTQIFQVESFFLCLKQDGSGCFLDSLWCSKHFSQFPCRLHLTNRQLHFSFPFFSIKCPLYKFRANCPQVISFTELECPGLPQFCTRTCGSPSHALTSFSQLVKCFHQVQPFPLLQSFMPNRGEIIG